MNSATISSLALLGVIRLLEAQAFVGHRYSMKQSSWDLQQFPLLSTQSIRSGAASQDSSRRPFTGTIRRSRKGISFAHLAKSQGTDNEENNANNAVIPEEDFERTQREIDAMMRDQDSASTQSTLFGLDTLSDNNGDDDDEDAYNAVPLFTGSLVLLVSLFFTGYGFFVFFTGDDPIFLNQQPTAPPPDSWYN